MNIYFQNSQGVKVDKSVYMYVAVYVAMYVICNMYVPS